ncbi:MAG: pyridoxine kinase [Aliidongia sp.]|jgi:pyridoxine kinase|nr:pyridoxine kinase [Aliidongia sp.]
MSILTIQSAVAYGHVGNSAAMFALQRLGFEAWAVNTVQFSNHPGYGAWRGRVAPAEEVAAVIQGIAERGVLPGCRAVLSGYLGDPALGEVVLDAVERVKAANPAALWCCDPVIGDTATGIYVRPGIAEFFRDRALEAADLVTPNVFEAEFLTGRRIESLSSALAACAALRARGPRLVLLTSLRRNDPDGERIGLLASSAAGSWLVETPLLPLHPNGAGDAVAALFLGNWLHHGDIARALEMAASAIHAVLKQTLASGEREIQLITAQEALVAPPERFAARRCD